MPALGMDGGIRRLGVENEFWMINIAVGRSLWRLGDLCLFLCTSSWLSSCRSPPCLYWLISLVFISTLLRFISLPAQEAPPSILSMSPPWPNWWLNTNKLPSLHPVLVCRPLSPPLVLFMLPICSSPSHPFCCSLHYSLCFPLDPEQERAWLNSQADSTVCPRVPKKCECMRERKKGERKTDWLTCWIIEWQQHQRWKS